MARKKSCFLMIWKYLLYVAAVASLCAGLVLLQQLCMNHTDGDFIASYCLADSHMRALLAAILTVVGVVLTASVMSAAESYRSAKLASGINEGVYIAMASQSVRYRLRALLTPWGPAMMLIILCSNAPTTIQTLANLGIRTARVYVRNPSTISIYDAYTYYNASVTQLSFADINTAIGVMTKMRGYATSATLTADDIASGVTTTVVRDAYLGSLNLSHSDATNAFKRLETVATVTSTCNSIPNFVGLLSETVAVKPTAVNLTLGAQGGFEAIIYNAEYDVLSDNSLLVQSTLGYFDCLSENACFPTGPNTPVTGSIVSCTSTVVVQDQEIIYTVVADTVTPTRLISNATTVNISDLADVLVYYAASPEITPEGLTNFYYYFAVYQLYANLPPGSFGDSDANVLHTKLCASSSLALNWLRTYAESPYVLTADLGGLPQFGSPVPLYNIVQLTYIPTVNIAVIAGVITGSACIVCLVGMAFATTAQINVKLATDSSLLYNADMALIETKQALKGGLSNDPNGQLALEFRADSILYCRELPVKHPDPADPTKENTYCRINISYSSAGAAPNKSENYW